MIDGHWAYKEWVEATAAKIVHLGLTAPAEHQAAYLDVQIRAAIAQALRRSGAQALRHGRSGKSDDDPRRFLGELKVRNG